MILFFHFQEQVFSLGSLDSDESDEDDSSENDSSSDEDFFQVAR